MNTNLGALWVAEESLPDADADNLRAFLMAALAADTDPVVWAGLLETARRAATR